jgi:hypothetical protein
LSLGPGVSFVAFGVWWVWASFVGVCSTAGAQGWNINTALLDGRHLLVPRVRLRMGSGGTRWWGRGVSGALLGPEGPAGSCSSCSRRRAGVGWVVVVGVLVWACPGLHIGSVVEVFVRGGVCRRMLVLAVVGWVRVVC